MFGRHFREIRGDVSASDALNALMRQRSAGTQAPHVNADTAMRHDAVWASVRSITNPIMVAPVSTHRGDQLADRATPASRIDTPRIIADPCGDWGIDREGFLTFYGDSLLLWGNAFAEITALNSRGWPDQLRPLHPNRITWKADPTTGRVAWMVDGAAMGRWPLGPLWHQALYPGAGPIGIPAIYHGARHIGLGLAAEEAASDWFVSGMHPSGIVSSEKVIRTEQDEAEAEIAKTKVNQAVRNREIIAVGGGFKFDPIQVPADQAQFLETIAANTATVARLFGVRPERIGGSAQGGSSLTYSNLETNEDQHITQAVNPVATVMMRGLSKMLPHRNFAIANLEDPRVLGAKVAAEVASLQLRSGMLTHGESRAGINRDPIPGIDPDAYVWPPMVNQSVSLSAVDESGDLVDDTTGDDDRSAIVDYIPAPVMNGNGSPRATNATTRPLASTSRSLGPAAVHRFAPSSAIVSTLSFGPRPTATPLAMSATRCCTTRPTGSAGSTDGTRRSPRALAMDACATMFAIC
ncbi:MAG: phage portal protein [Mycobacterium sp.]